MKKLLTVVLLCSGAMWAQATQHKHEKALIERNDLYDVALRTKDAETLRAIYAEEFVYTSPDGDLVDRDKQIQAVLNNGVNLKTSKSSDVRIRYYGDVAVMTGYFYGTGTSRGKPLEIHERYTAVWHFRKGKWVMIAEHGTFFTPKKTERSGATD